ncbi:hypothetical protein [Methanoculleus frigidifontis]|nr:hypothetical protein [Methanoculleus sp. FWC-SCC1]
MAFKAGVLVRPALRRTPALPAGIPTIARCSGRAFLNFAAVALLNGIVLY